MHSGLNKNGNTLSETENVFWLIRLHLSDLAGRGQRPHADLWGPRDPREVNAPLLASPSSLSTRPRSRGRWPVRGLVRPAPAIPRLARPMGEVSKSSLTRLRRAQAPGRTEARGSEDMADGGDGHRWGSRQTATRGGGEALGRL